MILTIRGVDDIVARINEELPPEIRIWGLVRLFPVSLMRPVLTNL